ncbi:hypothetical protein ACEPAI_4020 [Sanghuangporus weigelae]
MASPIFKDMLSLPQPAQSTGRIEALNLPVVDIAEHGNITDVLLRFIYPTDEPELPVELISGVLIAAQKYEMHCALKWAQKVIRTMCSGDGSAVLQAFALACNHHLEDEARLAAWKSLQYHLLEEPFIHSLDSASGRASMNLLKYHNEIGKKILGLFSASSTLPISTVESISCLHCLGTKVSMFLHLPQWWTNMRRYGWSEQYTQRHKWSSIYQWIFNGVLHGQSPICTSVPFLHAACSLQECG